MPTKVLPRQNDDLKLQYALKDQSGNWVDLTGATIVATLFRPASGTTTQDSQTVVGSPTTHNLEIVFGKAKMTDAGRHRCQVKITFPDTTVRRSEIDEFQVLGNIA